MVAALRPRDELAENVTRRAGELLGAHTDILDGDGNILGCSEGVDGAGVAHEHAGGGDATGHIQVPVEIENRSWQVLISERGDGEMLSPRLARVIIDMAISQAMALHRLPNHTELKNKFIFDVLHGTDAAQDDLARQGEILGMDFTRPRAVILIDASAYALAGASHDSESRLRRVAWRAQHVVASVVSFFNLPTDAICGYTGDGEVAVLKASGARDLGGWSDGVAGGNPSWANLDALKRACGGLLQRLRHDTSSPVSIGIGRYHPGISGLARSYEDARAALTLGQRFNGPDHVSCLDELGVAAFVGVADTRTRADLAAHLLSPLDREPELMQTLRTLFDEDCCPSTTASRLAIHRNTLSYRLDKIASLTGLDPRRFDDAVQMRLACVMQSL